MAPPEHQGFVRLPGEGCAFVNERWREAFANSGLRTCEDFFRATGEPLPKPGVGWRYRARLPLQLGAAQGMTYLKRFHGEPMKERIRRWFEDAVWSPAAEREVRVSAALRQTLIAAPEALAWGSSGYAFSPRSFVVLSPAPGTAMSSWVERQLECGAPTPWTSRKTLLRRLAELVAAFHAAGWRHRDLYLCHVFLQQHGGDFHLSLIDLHRVFRPRWRTRRWRVKDLAQLNYSADAAFFSRSLKLRFFLWYTGRKRLGEAERKLVRAILEKTRAIIRRSHARRAD